MQCSDSDDVRLSAFCAVNRSSHQQQLMFPCFTMLGFICCDTIMPGPRTVP